MEDMKITVSVIKADVGGVGGHTKPSDGLLDAIRNTVKNSADLLIIITLDIVETIPQSCLTLME